MNSRGVTTGDPSPRGERRQVGVVGDDQVRSSCECELEDPVVFVVRAVGDSHPGLLRALLLSFVEDQAGWAMARKDDFFEDLVHMPWWVSAVLAVLTYVGLRFILPSIHFKDASIREFARTASRLAWVCVIFVMTGVASALLALKKRRRLDRQTGIESIRALPWKEFEELVAEAFRRQGYAVTENHRGGSDGGVDVALAKDGKRYLVQCKSWRERRVGVRIAREMLGLVTAHAADGAKIITTGTFTRETHRFAQGQPIELIEGRALARMIGTAQRAPVMREEPVCGKCGAELVVRVARRGAQPGSKFWGCSRYPECRFTQPYAPVARI